MVSLASDGVGHRAGGFGAGFGPSGSGGSRPGARAADRPGTAGLRRFVGGAAVHSRRATGAPVRGCGRCGRPGRLRRRLLGPTSVAGTVLGRLGGPARCRRAARAVRARPRLRRRRLDADGRPHDRAGRGVRQPRRDRDDAGLTGAGAVPRPERRLGRLRPGPRRFGRRGAGCRSVGFGGAGPPRPRRRGHGDGRHGSGPAGVVAARCAQRRGWRRRCRGGAAGAALGIGERRGGPGGPGPVDAHG
ncbi:MAG: hypothetical protein JJLCMIEE_01062 [Acidimicrobiales bacterium]|nr:hypothetical protein [Acidimicrobiales bacterium]